MAEVLRDYVFSASHRRGVSKYDYLFDGQVWKLNGADFRSTANSLRATLTTLARRKGLKIRTREPEQGVLIVQAYKADARS